jgi:hypothetical protein
MIILRKILPKYRYKPDMIYKSWIIYSYIFGYTLLTKYRNLLIFTIFFFPHRLWRSNNYLQNHFISENWILNFYFWWYFANKKKRVAWKGYALEFGAGFHAMLWNPHEEWRLHKGPPPLLEVNVLCLDWSYEYVNLTIQLDRHRKRPFFQRNE